MSVGGAITALFLVVRKAAKLVANETSADTPPPAEMGETPE
jgi:hypothetical protein